MGIKDEQEKLDYAWSIAKNADPGSYQYDAAIDYLWEKLSPEGCPACDAAGRKPGHPPPGDSGDDPHGGQL